MEANLNVLLWFVGQIIVGAAIWGGIRVDIKNIHQRMTDLKDVADEAHKRIDRILEERRK